MKYYAIVVAGGSGNRMQNAVAKQFLLLAGKPILMHTLERFNECILKPEIILVLNIDQHRYWEDLCVQYNFDVPHRLVKGGVQRFHSVNNGLKTIKGNGIVAVHDAVRPLVSTELILASYQVAEEKGSAIVAVQPTDSVRMIQGEDTLSLKRDELYLIQTPQTFEVSLLKKAYKADYRNDFTDDSSVVEYAGNKLVVIPGSRDNIKITYAEDLEWAEFILQRKRLLK